MQPLTITKDQLDTLRTNPAVEYPYPATPCPKCQAPLQLTLVKLGSRADMAHDDPKEQLTNYMITAIFSVVDTLALTFFKKTVGLAPLKARLRVEKVHFDELYAGQTVILAGRCPHCQTELVASLTKS